MTVENEIVTMGHERRKVHATRGEMMGRREVETEVNNRDDDRKERNNRKTGRGNGGATLGQ